MTDDLDNKTPATKTLTLAVNGVVYELDLNDDHYDEAMRALAPYVANGRRMPAAPRSSGPRAVPGSKASNRRRRASIREWAARNGHDLHPRGRIPSAVAQAYEQAHRS
jgi:hypothetical protein